MRCLGEPISSTPSSGRSQTHHAIQRGAFHPTTTMCLSMPRTASGSHDDCRERRKQTRSTPTLTMILAAHGFPEIRTPISPTQRVSIQSWGLLEEHSLRLLVDFGVYRRNGFESWIARGAFGGGRLGTHARASSDISVRFRMWFQGLFGPRKTPGAIEPRRTRCGNSSQT